MKSSSSNLRGFLIGIGLIVVSTIGLPTAGMGADGYWWGSAITPGFDRNSVIQVEGIASAIFFL